MVAVAGLVKPAGAQQPTFALVQINQQTLFFNQMNQEAMQAAQRAGASLNTVHLGFQTPYITGWVFWDRQRWRVFLPAFQPAFVSATTSASA